MRKDFYKDCCNYYGDSGIGGNNPQEPVFELAEEPKDIADYWLSVIEQRDREPREAIEKLTTCSDCSGISHAPQSKRIS